jgi:hypothetical protein
MGIGIRHVRRKERAERERDELDEAFDFLVSKVINLDLKTEEGHDICPMFGFCNDCDDCLLDRRMNGE